MPILTSVPDLNTIGSVLLALIVAGVISLLLTPVVKAISIKVGAVDVPKDGRRMHDHPIPRLGGLAIFFGFIVAVLLFVPLDKGQCFPMVCTYVAQH